MAKELIEKVQKTSVLTVSPVSPLRLSLVALTFIFRHKTKLWVRAEKDLVELGGQGRYTLPKLLTRRSRKREGQD